jgi:MFS family permease
VAVATAGPGEDLVGSDSGAHRRHAFRSLAGNRALLRVLGGYALFILNEYAVWIAMLVYAYSRGGATTAGLVALAQLMPAAVLAPVVATLADRRSPVILLTGGYLVQAAAMGATAAAIIGGVPLAAYAAAVVAATAVTTTRPAQSTLIPSVASTADQLTAANVVAGWVEATGIAASGLLAGVLISLAGVGSVFAVCAGLGVAAGLLAAGLRVPALAAAPEGAGTALAELREGLRLAARRPRLRLMLALLTAEAIVVGALDLLFVILAITVLGRPQAWAGYLNSAYGVGAVAAATVSAVLVGRRLGGPIAGAALILSGTLAALALGLGLAGTVTLLAVAGASRALLDVASRTLLQRSVPARLIGRIFGLLEGLTMAGLALGALLVPLLMYLGGSRAALLGVAAVLPLAALAGGRALFGLDAGAPVPVVEIALLRSLPLFAELPAPAIEGIAAALTPIHLPAGAVLIRQGDPGDAYYAIAAGELDVVQDGRFLRRCGRREGVGEIALLRAIPRTATVTAHTPATVYELGRDPFLTAVLGHAPTRREADRIADTRLAAGAEPGPGDIAGPGAAGRLWGPVVVDLVEVAAAVGAPAAARPLPHERVLAGAGDPAEEARAGRRGAAGQAPARGRVGQAAGEGLVGPFVGVRQGRGGAGAEDLGPDGRRRVHASLVRGMAGYVGGEPVEDGPVEARRDEAGPDHAAARGGVDGVPAVVGGGSEIGCVPRELDVGEDHRVGHVPRRGVGQGPRRLPRPPGPGLAGGAVVVRIDPGPAHEPVHAGADALVIGRTVLVCLRAVGRGPDDDLVAAGEDRPVAGHADVPAVVAADHRHPVRRRPRDRDRGAVGPVPEPRGGVTRGSAHGPHQGERNRQCASAEQPRGQAPPAAQPTRYCHALVLSHGASVTEPSGSYEPA